MKRRDENVFTGEYDTPLTQAIDSCNYNEAIRIIKTYGHGRYLNEGPSGGKPLQKVLLIKPYHSSRNIVHLELAKLLVLAGANPDLGTATRIRSLEKDTAFEALISIIELMEDAVYFKGPEAKASEHLVCFGLQGEPLVLARQVSEQALKLLHIFLECGANPNLVTVKSLSTTFQLYLSQRHADTNTILKFHAAGANLSTYNGLHITPLMVLIMTASSETVLSLLREMWPPDEEMPNLNLKNEFGWTALCYVMYAGSVDVAIMLVQRGANLHACEINVNQNFSGAVKKVSICPLLFSLLDSSEKEEKREFSYENFQKLMSFVVAPVFDAIANSKTLVDEVGSNLLPLLPERWISEHEMNEHEVTRLILGKISSSLQQLCIRQIVTATICARKSEVIAKYMTPAPETQEELSDLYSVSEILASLHPHAVTKIVTDELHLPPILTGGFWIELARLEMGTVLFNYKKHSQHFYNDDSEMEEDSSGSELESSLSSSSSSSNSTGSSSVSSSILSSSRDDSSDHSDSSSDIAEQLENCVAISGEDENLSCDKVSKEDLAIISPCNSPDSVQEHSKASRSCNETDDESQNDSRYEPSPVVWREKYEALDEFCSDKEG